MGAGLNFVVGITSGIGASVLNLRCLYLGIGDNLIIPFGRTFGVIIAGSVILYQLDQLSNPPAAKIPVNITLWARVKSVCGKNY